VLTVVSFGVERFVGGAASEADVFLKRGNKTLVDEKNKKNTADRNDEERSDD